MISPDFFWSTLKKNNYSFFSGVPCSLLEAVLDNIPEDIKYTNAVREDSALGMASGASIAGVKAGILIQNSGLGNIINGLTSFNLIYKIPVLLIITWRGYGGKDAPEHLIMGDKMIDFLRIMNIPYKVVSRDFPRQVKWADREMKKKKIPVALIVKKDVIK